MANRATRRTRNLDTEIRTVETGQTVAEFRAVKDGNADRECQHAGAGENAFGVVLTIGDNPSVTAGAAGDRVTVATLQGPGVIPVKVGTGGATRGLYAKAVSDGVANATPVAGGGTLIYVLGKFAETGVAGDIVGLYPAPAVITET